MINMIEVIKSDFKLFKIKHALNAVLDKYPEIKNQEMFLQKTKEPEQLQFALYLLGFHVRVNPQGFIFGLKSLIPDPLIKNDYMETFKLLAEFAAPGCSVTIRVNNKTTQLAFDEMKVEKVKDVSQPIGDFEKLGLRPLDIQVVLDTFVPDPVVKKKKGGRPKKNPT